MTEKFLKGYKIIDLEIKGNTVRYYLAKDDTILKEYWGDDWDDRPYEHNASTVYGQYIEKIVDVFYPYDMMVVEPSNDWNYSGNSPFSKEDFKDRKAPRVCIYYPSNPWDDLPYSRVMADENVCRVYYGDLAEKALKDSVCYMEVEKSEDM